MAESQKHLKAVLDETLDISDKDVIDSFLTNSDECQTNETSTSSEDMPWKKIIRKVSYLSH
jgi:hypothetical protein